MNDSLIKTTFFRIKYIILASLLSFICKAQVIIASDGLNNSSSLFNLSGGSYYSGNSAAGDLPASAAFFLEGTHSRGISNGSAILTSISDINTTGYTSLNMTLRLGAFSIGSTNGLDGTDVVTVEVSPDGGVNWFNTVEVTGTSNAYWSYTGGTGNAAAIYDGDNIPNNFSPSSGGTQTTEGYSKITVSGLPSTTTLRFRITLLNNSSNERWVVDDFKVQGVVACVPPTISSVFPNSGPIGTNVTINASSGNLLGATAKFNGVLATVISTTATQMVVVVPPGATTGDLTITNASSCPVTIPFTIIKEDLTSCNGTGGSGNFTDLIVTEVYDSASQNVWHMELYNPTSLPIDLSASNYVIERYGDIGNPAPTRSVTLSGIIPPNSVFLLNLGDSGIPCAKTYGFTEAGAGINDGDEIKLTKNGVVVDVVECPIYKGYSIIRDVNATGPKSVFSNSDWTTTLSEDCSDLGTFPYTPPTKKPPVITLQPVFSPSCANISFTVAATEGFIGGNPLAYQWYALAPNTTTWFALTNVGVYSGVTTSTLNISSTTGLDGYQYYSQVRENSATCYSASNAVIIKAGASGGPVITNKTPTPICSGTVFTVTPINTLPDIVPTGTTYTWAAPIIAPAAAIIGGSARTTPIGSISQILTNTTSTLATAVYTVTADSGGCTSTFTITVTVNPLPTITAIPNNRCGTGVVTIGATASSGTINWYSNPTGGSSIGSGSSFTTPSISSTTTYWAEVVDGTCISPTRTSVEAAVVSSAPSPTVVSPLYYCQNSPSVALTASSLSGATLNWYATATSTPALASAPIPSRNTVGSATYYVSQSVGSCESARVAIVVNVVADTGAKADILRCDPSQATAANTVFIDWSHVPGRSTNDYGYSYSIAGAPLVFGRTPLSSLEIFGVLPEDSVTFTILDVPGVPCYVPQTITTTKKAVFNTIPTTICNGAAPPSLPLLSDNGVSGNWLPAQVSNTATGTYVFTPDPTLFPCAISFSQKITVNPLANAGILSGGPNVCLGSTTLFSSTVSGGTWSSSDTAIATVSNIGLVTGVGSGTATIFYTALGTGGCLQDQKSLPITVSSPPNAGTLSGGPNVCLGSTTLFSSTVSGGSWSSSNTAIATVSNTGLVTGVGSGTATIFYTALGTGGCLQDQKSLPITVSSPPNAGTLSGGPNVCLGSTTLLSSTVSGGTWSSSDTAIATVSNTGLVTGVTSGTAFIRYTVLGSGVCPSAYQEITVVVNPSTVPTFSSIGPLCAGTEISLPTASIEGTTGTWSPVFNATKTLSYTFTPSTGQCATTTKLTVTIIALPVATATPKNSSICSDTTTAISISSGIAGTTYTWNVVQTNVTGALAGSGDTIAQTLKATVDNKSGEAVYSITPTANGCPGLPILSTVTVNPIPDVSANPSPATVCSGEQTAIILTSKVPGTTFSWTADPLAVIGSSSDTGSTITQTLVTNSLIPGTVDYTITPKANSCVGLPIVVNVTVNPTPEVFGSGATVICSGESTNIILSPKILGTDFTWTVLPKGVTGAEDGGGSNTINQILEAGSTVGTAEYTITPILNGCQGNSIPIVITVNPSPEPVLEDGIICVKENTGTTYKNYLLDTGLSNSLYDFKWFKDDSQIDGASSNTYEVTEEGLYSVIATNTTTSCISEEEFARVIPNYPAVSLTTTITDAFTPEATITVNPQGGTGPFLYRLDEGPLQSSNVFVGVSSGVHKVWIEDAQGCTYLSQVVTVIDYPKYFTPNGDGFNDTWNVIGLNDQPDAKIYIFDRYGKLLKQISTIGGGWNGTFNGYELPGSDYWFTIEYLENDIKKLFKAHFSLKR